MSDDGAIEDTEWQLDRSVVVYGADQDDGLEIMKSLLNDSGCRWVVGVVADGKYAHVRKALRGEPSCKLMRKSVGPKALVERLKLLQITPDLLLLYSRDSLSCLSPFYELSEEDLRRSFQCEVEEPVQVILAFLPVMRAVPKSVIASMSSSWAAVGGKRGYAQVCASKQAFEGFVKSAALDCVQDEISLVTVDAQPAQGQAKIKAVCKAVLGLGKADSGKRVSV